MSDAIQLGSNGIIDCRDSMAMDVAPERRMTIEIAPALIVDQNEAFCIDNDRSVFLRVGRHRRKRMPDVSLIQLP